MTLPIEEPVLEDVEQALAVLGMTQTASEYHGAVCGLVCAGQPVPVDLGMGSTGPRDVGHGAIAARELLGRLPDAAEAFFKVVADYRGVDVSIRAEDMAEVLGTIGYEVVCDLSPRVERRYT